MRNQRRVTLIPTKVYDVTDETYKKTVATLLHNQPIPTQKTDEWDMNWMTAGGTQYDPKNRYYYDTDMKTKLLHNKERKLNQEQWIAMKKWEGAKDENGKDIMIQDEAAAIIYITRNAYNDKKLTIEIKTTTQIHLLVFRQNLATLSPTIRR
jgi:hypothetical protein